MPKNNNSRWQSELRRQLEREAFNRLYKCYVCGAHENLHVHHLVYSTIKEEYFNPSAWVILCASCHAQTPKDSKTITGSHNDETQWDIGWENYIRKARPRDANYLIARHRRERRGMAE